MTENKNNSAAATGPSPGGRQRLMDAAFELAATTRSLDAKGVAYTVVDLTEDDDALRFVESLGYRQAPVVISGADHWSGFRPDRIAAL